MTYSKWDTVVVPFPFTERASSKHRPALVLSGERFNSAGHTVLSMITTSRVHSWPGDTDITDLDSAGLRVVCFVRLKMFTLDNRLIVNKLGAISFPDRTSVERAMTEMLG